MGKIINAADEGLEVLIEKLDWLCKEAEIEPVNSWGGDIDLRIKIRAATRLLDLKKLFLDNKAPEICFLDAVVISFEHGLGVPRWAHQKLSIAFASFVDQQGDADIGKLLGFSKSPGRHRRMFQRLLSLQKELRVVDDVTFLSKIVGLTQQISFYLTSVHGIPLAPPNKGKIFADIKTIQKIYKKSDEKVSAEDFLKYPCFEERTPQQIFEIEYEKYFYDLLRASSDRMSADKFTLTKNQADRAIKKYERFMNKKIIF